MKVLFAVNNENISETIIKNYQETFKEIITAKNVYYFNAIIKELQRDKSYDRIIISEDLEPFSNNNYETIDKFIFEKLDRRSIKLRYNAYCSDAKKYRDNPAAIVVLYNECVKYNKSLNFRKVEGSYDGEYKQGEPLDLSVFSEDIVKWNEIYGISESVDTDEWGEPDPLEHDFTVAEIIEMPVISNHQYEDNKTVVSREEAEKMFA